MIHSYESVNVYISLYIFVSRYFCYINNDLIDDVISQCHQLMCDIINFKLGSILAKNEMALGYLFVVILLP